jgi:uncharacterized delta-60 repeat protein
LNLTKGIGGFFFTLALFLSLSGRVYAWTWDLALTRYASARQIAVQSDGKMVIGGDFDFVGRVRRAGLARLHVDGSLDSSYQPTLRKALRGISGVGDDLLVATGHGSEFLLQRFHRDGSRDTGFMSRVFEVGFSPSENDPYSFPAKLLPSGKILLVGAVTHSTSPAQLGLLLLNPDGTLDESFHPPNFSLAMEFSVELSGSILVVSGQGLDSALLRIDGNTGEVRASFPIRFAKSVYALRSGKFLVTGNLPNGRKINRYQSNGSIDETYAFNTGQDLWRSPCQLRDGRFIWLGSPTMLLSPEGELIAEWSSADDFNPNYGAIAETADGKIVYSAYPVAGTEPRLATHGLLRRSLDGTLDASFQVTGGLMRGPPDHGFSDERLESYYGLGDSLYLHGPFNYMNGTNTGGFVRLRSDRSIDWPFNNNIRAQALAPDHLTVEYTEQQTLLVGSRVRLSADGEPILNFPGVDTCITSVASLPLLNGASIHNYRYGGPCTIHGAGGTYSSYRSSNGAEIKALELTQDGLFPPIFSQPVAAAVPAATPGKFLIGGAFTSVNGVRATNLALITPAGDVDPSFSVSEYVQTPAFLFKNRDEFIGVVEDFTTYPRSFYRLDQQGRVLQKTEFPASIVTVQKALFSPKGQLIILSRGYEPDLLIAVFDLDGTLVRDMRLPYTFSDYHGASGTLSPEGDLLVAGSYFGNDSNAWTGIARISAAELTGLRLDLSRAGISPSLSIRAPAGASIGLYESENLKTWQRNRVLTIPAEGRIVLSIDTPSGSKYFKAQFE